MTVEQLVAEPRWDRARLVALPGRARGDLLGPWGRNVEARFGAGALARVRARIGAPLDQLAAVLTADDWVPVHAQLVVTEAIVDELLAGDLRALYPLLVDDTRKSVGRVKLLLARGMGAARALRLSTRIVPSVYERGAADVAVEGRRARVAYRGNAVFANPTWRVLQLFAMKMMLELTGSPGETVGERGDGAGADDTFVAIATW